MPSLVIDGALYIISGAIEKRCGMNLVETCNPIRDVPYMRIPLLLLHGTLDKDVPVMHSEAIFNNYGSTDKTLLKIEQGKNRIIILSVVTCHIHRLRTKRKQDKNGIFFFFVGKTKGFSSSEVLFLIRPQLSTPC